MRRRRLSRRGGARHGALVPALIAALLIVAAFAYGRVSGRMDARSTPAPTAVTGTVVLDEFSFYAIQFGAFDNDEDARALTQRYVSRGAAGYVLTDTRSRAIGAAYTSRADADKVCANLAAQGVDSYVYEVSAPRVELRVTASPELVSAMESARKAMLHAIDALSGMALELDKGTMTTDAAISALYAQAEAADGYRTELERALGGRTHAATSGMMSELSAVSDACRALVQQNTSSPMAFSAKIKYNVIDLMQRHVQFMQMLIQPEAHSPGKSKG